MAEDGAALSPPSAEGPKSDDGASDDSEGFVIRSGVRNGLKREFTFALRCQAELTASLPLTRARRPPSLFAPSISSSTKKPRRSKASKKPPFVSSKSQIPVTPMINGGGAGEGEEDADDHESKKIRVSPNELLTMGWLNGARVKYKISDEQQGGLVEGELKNGKILCSCSTCRGSEAMSVHQFEQHAVTSNSSPWDCVYVESGQTISHLYEERIQNLNMLEAVRESFTGLSSTQLQYSVCQKWEGKSDSLGDTCLEHRQTRTTPTPSYHMESSDNSDKLSGSIFGSDSSESTSMSLSSHENNRKRKISKRDSNLHKSVFEALLSGTKVGYYSEGKFSAVLVEGCIEEGGIHCHCCNLIISASAFESHAGRAQRRKPYHYIHTSEGVSLHELSMSLSCEEKSSARISAGSCGERDYGDLVCCGLCPKAFHIESVGLTSIPNGHWQCKYCQEAIAAGSVPEVKPNEQIPKRCTRKYYSSCALCRRHDFAKTGFGPRTVIICDQCDQEFHVQCLKEHNMGDLQELPPGDWFCSTGCSEVHASLQELLLCGPQEVSALDSDVIMTECEEKGLNSSGSLVSWRLLSGKASGDENKSLLRDAESVFHESFGQIVDSTTEQDLIPFMVNGMDTSNRDFGRMYCVVLIVNSSVASAGILRVLGSEVAEIPLVATRRENRAQGYFRSLFFCIERLLSMLNVKHLVLPAAEEAESIWMDKFGFAKISLEQINQYTKGVSPMIFDRTSMLHKLLPGVGIFLSSLIAHASMLDHKLVPGVGIDPSVPRALKEERDSVACMLEEPFF